MGHPLSLSIFLSLSPFSLSLSGSFFSFLFFFSFSSFFLSLGAQNLIFFLPQLLYVFTICFFFTKINFLSGLGRVQLRGLFFCLSAGLHRPVKIVGSSAVASWLSVVTRRRAGGTKKPAFTYVVTRGVVVHVVVSVAGGFVVKCCLVATLLERCRLRCCSISVNLGTAPPRSGQQAHPPSACARPWAGLTTHRSFWHFHSHCTFQRIGELLRLICGQLLLGRQVTLVLDEKLVDTVTDVLVDLLHPRGHVVE